MGEILDQGFAARKASYDLLLQKVEGGKALTANEVSAMTRFEKELVRSGLDMPLHLDGIEDVEAYTGYKARTIYAAIKSGALPRLSDGRFLTAEVDAFLSSKGKRPQVRVMDGDDGDNDDDGDSGGVGHNARQEEAKYRHFRARREEIIVKRLEGELISRDDLTRAWVARMHEFRTALLLLNRRVSYKIAVLAGIETKQVDEILDAEARALLTSMSRKVTLHVD